MTKKLTTSAIMIALATVLAWVSKIIPSPWLQGGQITIASMVPVIIISIMFNAKWGLLGAFAYSLIQMLMGFYPPPTPTFGYFLLVVLLDYVIAFGVLGLAGTFYRMIGKKVWAIPVSGAIVTFLRYICHILSGMLIWSSNASEGQGALIYSVSYNGGYMIPEIIITTIVLALLGGFIKKIIKQ